jgi:hypothetical protein
MLSQVDDEKEEKKHEAHPLVAVAHPAINENLRIQPAMLSSTLPTFTSVCIFFFTND